MGTNLQTPLNASGRASGEFGPIVFFSTPWIILGIHPGPQTPGQNLSVEQAQWMIQSEAIIPTAQLIFIS